MRNTHRIGNWLLVCDECGLTYYNDKIHKRWDGAIVCEKDWEPRHPQEYVHARSDPKPLTKVRPDTLVLTVDNTAPSTVGETGVSAKTGPATHLFT
jgi:hypothetical protein